MKQMNNPPDFELVDMDIDGPCVTSKSTDLTNSMH